MDENVLLSIVIPIYNGKAYIKSTVEAALKIRNKKEIIIIDDGSIDDSYAYCNELWKNEKQIIIERKDNGGIVEARNYGMNLARGKYIIFVDHDDVPIAEVIDEAIDKAEINNYELVFWTTKRMYDTGEIIPCDTVNKEMQYTDCEVQEILLKEMLINQNNSNISYIGHLWAVLYRLDKIKINKIAFKRFVDFEDDYLFVLDCLTKVKRVFCMPATGYLWRYNKSSESYRIKYIPDILSKYEKLYKYILKQVELVCDISDVKESYIRYIKLLVLIKSVENSFTCVNNNKNDKKQILNAIKKERIVFVGETCIANTKRRRRIFKFIKAGFIRLAFFYVYLDSIYRKIKLKKK